MFQRIRASDTDVVINFTAGMGGDVGFGAGENPHALDKEQTDLVGPLTRLPHVEDPHVLPYGSVSSVCGDPKKTQNVDQDFDQQKC